MTEKNKGVHFIACTAAGVKDQDLHECCLMIHHTGTHHAAHHAHSTRNHPGHHSRHKSYSDRPAPVASLHTTPAYHHPAHAPHSPESCKAAHPTSHHALRHSRRWHSWRRHSWWYSRKATTLPTTTAPITVLVFLSLPLPSAPIACIVPCRQGKVALRRVSNIPLSGKPGTAALIVHPTSRPGKMEMITFVPTTIIFAIPLNV